MGIIVANLFITLDGVYQAPGGREEDLEGGFAYGPDQWISSMATGAAIGEEIGRIDSLLLGRKTYDIFAAYWPHQTDEIGGTLNRVPKFVVSSTLAAPEWAGTTVLPDAAAAGRLREEYDQVHMFGSGVLIRSLLEASGSIRSPWGRASASSTPGPSPQLSASPSRPAASRKVLCRWSTNA